jgi:hypothetical protein
MTQAAVVYRRNPQPSRGLAATGALFFIKAVLMIPHAIIIGALSYVAWAVAYIGYWVVALTGNLPTGMQSMMQMWLRWGTRSYGWLAGITDQYPPFDPDPRDYPIDLQAPTNDAPRQGWAVAGIFLVKLIAALPHLFILALVEMAAALAAWVGFVVVVFTGRLPEGIQDFVAGTMQWYARVMSWVFGLTDEYPPFTVEISPKA